MSENKDNHSISEDLGGSQELQSPDTQTPYFSVELKEEGEDLDIANPEEATIIKGKHENEPDQLMRNTLEEFLKKLEKSNSELKSQIQNSNSELKSELKSQIQNSNSKLEQSNSELKSQIQNSNSELKSELKSQIQNLNIKLENQMQEIKETSQNQVQEIKDLREDLRNHVEESKLASEKLEIRIRKEIETNSERAENMIEAIQQDFKSQYIVLNNEVQEIRNYQKETVVFQREVQDRVESIKGELDSARSEVSNLKEEVKNITLAPDNVVKGCQSQITRLIAKLETQELTQCEINQNLESELSQVMGRVENFNDIIKSNAQLLHNNLQDEIGELMTQCESKVYQRLEDKFGIDKDETINQLEQQIKHLNVGLKDSSKRIDCEWQNYKLELESRMQAIDYNRDNFTKSKKVVQSKGLSETQVKETNNGHNNQVISELHTVINPVESIYDPLNEARSKVMLEPESNSSMALKFLKIKFFRGEYLENPHEYLQNLEELFTLCHLSEIEKIAIAANHLCAASKDWWQSLFIKPETYGDFKYLMLASFWGEDRQDNLRYQISQERYHVNKGSYTQFFRSQAVKLKTLTAYPLSETQIVRIIRHNLPRHIEQILIAADRHTIEEVVEILDSLETSDRNIDNRIRVNRDTHPMVSNINFADRSHMGRRKLVREKGYYRTNPYGRQNSHLSRPTVKSRILNENQPSTSGIPTIPKKNIKGSKSSGALN